MTHDSGVVISRFLLLSCELVVVFVCKGENWNYCVKNVVHHNPKFGCLGDQVPRICAPLIESNNTLKKIHVYYLEQCHGR